MALGTVIPRHLLTMRGGRDGDAEVAESSGSARRLVVEQTKLIQKSRNRHASPDRNADSAAAACAATMVGECLQSGCDRLHLVLGFSAGAVIGVSFL